MCSILNASSLSDIKIEEIVISKKIQQYNIFKANIDDKY